MTPIVEMIMGISLIVCIFGIGTAVFYIKDQINDVEQQSLNSQEYNNELNTTDLYLDNNERRL